MPGIPMQSHHTYDSNLGRDGLPPFIEEHQTARSTQMKFERESGTKSQEFDVEADMWDLKDTTTQLAPVRVQLEGPAAQPM
jgi:hypothetical protein